MVIFRGRVYSALAFSTGLTVISRDPGSPDPGYFKFQHQDPGSGILSGTIFKIASRPGNSGVSI